MEYKRITIEKPSKKAEIIKRSDNKTKITYTHYPEYIIRKELYKQENTEIKKDTDETNEEIRVHESILKYITIAITILYILCTGLHFAGAEPPRYIRNMFYAVTSREEKQIRDTDQSGKVIGAKEFIEKEEEIKEENTQNINENSRYAETIKEKGTEKQQVSDEINTTDQGENDKAAEVLAKNMSKGSDRIYITNKTDLKINPDILLSNKYPIEKIAKGSKEPRVLIIHTHGTEAYIDTGTESNTRSKDRDKNVVRVGEELTRVLTAYGINVIHSKTMHDEISYIRSYENSKKEAMEYLEKYPTIQYIIDIHRDALGTEENPVKTYTEINGETAAQLMFVMGTNAAGGNHPNYEKNLTVAVHMQNKANELFPGLMRPVNIRPILFNQDLRPGCMILEVGSDANKMSEALAAVRMFGRVFAETI